MTMMHDNDITHVDSLKTMPTFALEAVETAERDTLTTSTAPPPLTPREDDDDNESVADALRALCSSELRGALESVFSPTNIDTPFVESFLNRVCDTYGYLHWSVFQYVVSCGINMRASVLCQGASTKESTASSSSIHGGSSGVPTPKNVSASGSLQDVVSAAAASVGIVPCPLDEVALESRVLSDEAVKFVRPLNEAVCQLVTCIQHTPHISLGQSKFLDAVCNNDFVSAVERKGWSAEDMCAAYLESVDLFIIDCSVSVLRREFVKYVQMVRDLKGSMDVASLTLKGAAREFWEGINVREFERLHASTTTPVTAGSSYVSTPSVSPMASCFSTPKKKKEGGGGGRSFDDGSSHKQPSTSAPTQKTTFDLLCTLPWSCTPSSRESATRGSSDGLRRSQNGENFCFVGQSVPSVPPVPIGQALAEVYVDARRRVDAGFIAAVLLHIDQAESQQWRTDDGYRLARRVVKTELSASFAIPPTSSRITLPYALARLLDALEAVMADTESVWGLTNRQTNDAALSAQGFPTLYRLIMDLEEGELTKAASSVETYVRDGDDVVTSMWLLKKVLAHIRKMREGALDAAISAIRSSAVGDSNLRDLHEESLDHIKKRVCAALSTTRDDDSERRRARRWSASPTSLSLRAIDVVTQKYVARARFVLLHYLEC